MKLIETDTFRYQILSIFLQLAQLYERHLFVFLFSISFIWYVLRLRNKKLKLQKKQILSQTGADQTRYNDVIY